MKGDYKIMVRVNIKEEWEDFSGIFYNQKFEDVEEHVKKHFNDIQFKKYQFAIFRKEREHDYYHKEASVWGLKKIIRFK